MSQVALTSLRDVLNATTILMGTAVMTKVLVWTALYDMMQWPYRGGGGDDQLRTLC